MATKHSVESEPLPTPAAMVAALDVVYFRESFPDDHEVRLTLGTLRRIRAVLAECSWTPGTREAACKVLGIPHCDGIYDRT